MVEGTVEVTEVRIDQSRTEEDKPDTQLQINKSLAQALLLSLPFKSQKTNHLFQ